MFVPLFMMTFPRFLKFMYVIEFILNFSKVQEGERKKLFEKLSVLVAGADEFMKYSSKIP